MEVQDTLPITYLCALTWRSRRSSNPRTITCSTFALSDITLNHSNRNTWIFQKYFIVNCDRIDCQESVAHSVFILIAAFASLMFVEPFPPPRQKSTMFKGVLTPSESR